MTHSQSMLHYLAIIMKMADGDTNPLFETLLSNKPLVSGGLSLKLNNVGFKIKKSRGGAHEILRDVSGHFLCGKVTAMLGPSGAGKTSLLSLLSGHAQDWGEVSGAVTVNGKHLSNAMFRKLGTLVPQDDVLLPGLTVRQTLTFGAALTCKGLNKKARADRVQELIEDLGLTICAHVLVGGSSLRGVSGGQRKRVSIALELLADPPLLFLDEPTSGLDSKMAEDVVSLLTRLARGSSERHSFNSQASTVLKRSPIAVVCTIHQPSYFIFRNFDEVLFLAQSHQSLPMDASVHQSPGVVAYRGPASQLVSFMASKQVPCPEFENPCDHMMRLLQDPASLQLILQDVPREFDTSPVEGDKDEEKGIRNEEDEMVERALERGGFAVGYFRQLFLLAERFAMDYFRDPRKFLQGLLVRTAIGVILGVVWLNQADGTQTSIFPIQGALFACCLNGTMDTVFQTALLMPSLKPLLFREYRNGSYALLPMLLSLFAINATAQVLNIIALSIPVYYLVGLRPGFIHFAIFTAALSSLVTLGVGVGIAVGSNANSFQEAQAAVVPLLLPLILFSGYIIPYAQIPIYFRFLYNISFFQHAIAILEVNEFRGRGFSDCPPSFGGWDDDTQQLGSHNQTWTCEGLSNVILNNSDAFGNLSPPQVLSTCASHSDLKLCYQTGDELLHDLHINEDAILSNFLIIFLCIVLSLVLSYIALCRALHTSVFCRTC